MHIADSSAVPVTTPEVLAEARDENISRRREPRAILDFFVVRSTRSERAVLVSALVLVIFATAFEAGGALVVMQGILGIEASWITRMFPMLSGATMISAGILLLLLGATIRRFATGRQISYAITVQERSVIAITARTAHAEHQWNEELSPACVSLVSRACSNTYRILGAARLVSNITAIALQILVLTCIAIYLVPWIAIPLLLAFTWCWIGAIVIFMRRGSAASREQQRLEDVVSTSILRFLTTSNRGGSAATESAQAALTYTERSRALARRELAGENARLATTSVLACIIVLALWFVSTTSWDAVLTPHAIAGAVLLTVVVRRALGVASGIVMLGALGPYVVGHCDFIYALSQSESATDLEMRTANLIFAPTSTNQPSSGGDFNDQIET